MCAYMIYVAYAQKGEREREREGETTFFAVGAKAPSLHVRMRMITVGVMALYKKCHITTYKVGDVLL